MITIYSRVVGLASVLVLSYIFPSTKELYLPSIIKMLNVCPFNNIDFYEPICSLNTDSSFSIYLFIFFPLFLLVFLMIAPFINMFIILYYVHMDLCASL